MTTARELALANPLHVQAALQGAALSDLPRKSRLAKLNIPTIIFAWRNDKTHPESTAKILADTLPNVHSLNITDADDTGQWVSIAYQFLDQLSAGNRRKSAA